MDTPDPATYSALRRVNPNLFHRTIENIRCLVSRKKEVGSDLEIGATCIIGDANTEQLMHFCRFDA